MSVRTDDDPAREPGPEPGLSDRQARPERGLRAVPDSADPADPGELLRRVARGDEDAFAGLYDVVAARVFGLARRVLRDSAQAEEVAQEALVEVWRTAARYDQAKGSALAWVLTITHRRAVDRVRAAQAGVQRERRVVAASAQTRVRRRGRRVSRRAWSSSRSDAACRP